jgi:hypothetical protein
MAHIADQFGSSMAFRPARRMERSSKNAQAQGEQRDCAYTHEQDHRVKSLPGRL